MRFPKTDLLRNSILLVGGLLGLSVSFSLLFAQSYQKIPPKISPPDAAFLKQYDTLAAAYLKSEELEKMYIVIQKGLSLANKSKNELYQGIFFFHKAYYFKRKYQTDSGIAYARKAIPIFQRHKDWKRSSHMMYRLSTFYLDNKDQVSAMKQLDALLRFNEKYNEHNYTGAAYNLLAFTFRRLRDTLNQKKYILKELEFVEKQNSNYERVYVYDEWATYLAGQKKFKEAHAYYTKAYTIVQTQQNDEAKAELLINMGANLLNMKEYDKALQAFHLTEKIALKHQRIAGWNAILSTDYANISSLFLATGKPKEALDYAHRSFALVENESLRYEYLIRALKNQIAAQKALKNYQEALQAYEKLQAITHSIDLNKDREIAKNIEAKYQFEKSEREKEVANQNLRIKDLELQNEQKQGRILSILLGLLALSLCGGFWFYRKNQVFNRQISNKNQQLQQLNETKDKLFGIIGHDLRAPVVDLINTLTLLENTSLTAQQLYSQSASLRKKALTIQTILNNLLYWAFSQRHLLRTNPQFLSLKNSLEDTLDSLHGLLEEKSLRIEWLTSEQNEIYADENHVQIILYNVIHNAIKFSPLYSVIEISTIEEASYIVLHLTNSGEKFEWEGNAQKPTLVESHRGTLGEKGTGLGLLVCAELMKLNRGTISAHHNLKQGTTVIMAFPSFHIAS